MLLFKNAKTFCLYLFKAYKFCWWENVCIFTLSLMFHYYPAKLNILGFIGIIALVLKTGIYLFQYWNDDRDITLHKLSKYKKGNENNKREILTIVTEELQKEDISHDKARKIDLNLDSVRENCKCSEDLDLKLDLWRPSPNHATIYQQFRASFLENITCQQYNLDILKEMFKSRFTPRTREKIKSITDLISILEKHLIIFAARGMLWPFQAIGDCLTLPLDLQNLEEKVNQTLVLMFQDFKILENIQKKNKFELIEQLKLNREIMHSMSNQTYISDDQANKESKYLQTIGDFSENEPSETFSCKQDTFMAIALWKADSQRFELDFHEIERGILYDQGCVKMVIRLIKYLRDIKGGHFFKLWSHLLKTLVMHQVIENQHNPSFWSERNLDKLFILCLSSLYESLENRCITDVIFPQFNMLTRIKQEDVISGTKQWLSKVLQEYEHFRDLLQIFPSHLVDFDDYESSSNNNNTDNDDSYDNDDNYEDNSDIEDVDKNYEDNSDSNANYDDHDEDGPRFIYKLNEENTKDFFASVTKEGIDSISLGQDCFIILYSVGDTAWSSGLPKHLHNKLNGRQRWLPRPEVIALGLRSPDSYYVQFEDGKTSWCDLPYNLERAIEKNDESVDLIAIGDHDEYYVRFKDGTEDWNLPLGLSNLLNGRNGTRVGNPGLAELTSISLSDKGEWVVGFSDGQWKWNSNNNDIFDEEVTKEMRSCDEVLEFQMGANGNFVFLYEE